MKIFRITPLILFAFLVLGCNKTEINELNNDTYASNVSNKVVYSTTWKQKDRIVLVDMLVDVCQDKLIEFQIEGKVCELQELKAVSLFRGSDAGSQALSFFDQCINMGYECVRVDRWDESAQVSLTGKPTSYYTVIYGHPNEEGDCDWDALWHEH